MKQVNWFWTKKYVSICLVLVICHNWLKSIERFFKCFNFIRNHDQTHITIVPVPVLDFTQFRRRLTDLKRMRKKENYQHVQLLFKWKIINTNNLCSFLSGIVDNIRHIFMRWLNSFLFTMSCLYKSIKSFKIYEWKQQFNHNIPLLLFPESIFSQ